MAFYLNSDNSKFDKEQFKLVLDVCPGYGNIERDEYFTILDKKVNKKYIIQKQQRHLTSNKTAPKLKLQQTKIR